MIRSLVLAALLLPTLASASSPPEDTVVSARRSPPSVEQVPFEAFFRMGALWVQDPGLDLVSETDALPRAEFGVSYAPWSSALSFELSYGIASTSAKSFEIIQSTMILHQFQVGAIGYLPLTGGLRARGRAGGGFELAHLELEVEGGPTYSDTVPLLALEATAGLEWNVPLALPSTLFSLVMDVGYGFRPLEAGFDGLERRVGDDAPKRVRDLPVDAGALDLSGWVLRFGLSLRR